MWASEFYLGPSTQPRLNAIVILSLLFAVVHVVHVRAHKYPEADGKGKFLPQHHRVSDKMVDEKANNSSTESPSANSTDVVPSIHQEEGWTPKEETRAKRK